MWCTIWSIMLRWLLLDVYKLQRMNNFKPESVKQTK